MVVGSLVMAAGVAVTALVAMLGRMPFPQQGGHGVRTTVHAHEAEPGPHRSTSWTSSSS